jgi:hypothetical protein
VSQAGDTFRDDLSRVFGLRSLVLVVLEMQAESQRERTARTAFQSAFRDAVRESRGDDPATNERPPFRK